MGHHDRPRVLIVDDAVMTRGILRLMLEIEGCDVIGEAGVAGDVLALVERLQPDIVFLDINLPDGNGIAVLRRLRAAWPQVAVVMITVDDSAARIREAIREGALGYVIKPLSEDRAMATIRNILHSYQTLTGSMPRGRSPVP